MAVDSLGPIDPVSILKDIDRTAATPRADDAEPGGLSTEARVVAEIEEAMDVVNRSPTVREELVADVKARLRDPEYLNSTVLDRITERLQDRFGT